VLAGYEVPSLKVRLFDGSFHQVDSDSFSFEQAAKFAFREACRKANPILLEPIMKLEVITPEENTGDVVGMEMKNNANVIKAKVPLSEMFGYVTDLRTITSGRATSIMEFSHYAQAPNNITEQVVAKAKSKVKAD
jgi:elongation factor G